MGDDVPMWGQGVDGNSVHSPQFTVNIVSLKTKVY